MDIARAGRPDGIYIYKYILLLLSLVSFSVSQSVSQAVGQSVSNLVEHSNIEHHDIQFSLTISWVLP